MKISRSNPGVGLTLLLNNRPSSKPTSYKVEFESFTLAENGVSRLPISEDEYDLILKALPTAQSVGVYPLFVVVKFKCLPPKPWPLTIAGLPAFFTTKEYTAGFEYCRLGGSLKKALNNYDARHQVTRELFDAVILYSAQEEISIPILSVLNLAGPWIVTIPYGVQFSSLPFLLAKAPCHFKDALDAEQHKEAAFRNTEPVGTVWDQTLYEPI